MASPADVVQLGESEEKAFGPALSGPSLPPYGLGVAPWEGSAGNAVPTRALANTIRWFALWMKCSTCFFVLLS
jgi:hypothetical protein